MKSYRTPHGAAPLGAALLVALITAACGGGSTGGDEGNRPQSVTRMRAQAVNPALWVAVPAVADPLLQNLAIPADAPTRGMWSGVASWPLNALHLAVLPNGKVLGYGSTPDGGGQNGRYFDVWDPTLGTAAASHQMNFRGDYQDSFCSAATYLGDGRLMISGGNGRVTSQFVSSSGATVTAGTANLADERWYATMLTLPDGRPVMLGGMAPYSEGMQGNPNQSVAQGLASMTPEVYENGNWRALPGAYSRDAFGPDFLRASYPRAWVMPGGRVFGVSAERMWSLDPAGNGAITVHGAFKTAPGNLADPPNVGATNGAVMFDIGKVLIAGGNGSFNGDGWPASNKATVIDMNGGTPVLREQAAMANPRRYPNALVLPDGRVLMTGGTRRGNDNGASSVFAAELWNPDTGTWTTAASAAIFRGYHSTSALLPNGTVLSAGGGAPGPVTNTNAEIFYPPQLFRSVNGVAQLAPRPLIAAISGLSYAHGGELQLDMANAGPIAKLSLVGLSNGTHSFNAGQRRIPLAFTQDTIRLSSRIPAADIVPPGYYQVVAIDAAGVPSRGVIVGIGQGVTAPPVTTTPYNPAALNTPIEAPLIAAGGSASYTLAAQPRVSYSWNFGDGSSDTPFQPTASINHVFAQPGLYTVTVTARTVEGATSRRTFVQAVAAAATARKPSVSTAMVLEPRSGAPARLWVVNPDGDSVAVFDTAASNRVAEIAVGRSPRSVALAPDGRVWVVNKTSATISIVNPATLAVVQTVNLPRASQPHGLAFAPGGGSAYLVLEAAGQLLKLDAASGAQQAALAVGANPRHVSVTADAATVLISRFITPALPGESTATVDTGSAGGEVLAVNAAAMTVNRSIVLRHSDKTDTEIQGAGIPNYLGAAVISPDGTSAWVPGKQDNIKRGTLRNGQNLNFQNTVRAISSRIDMATQAEDAARRIDHDNASLGSAAAFHPRGVYLFVALETSREVAVVNAIGGSELFRIDVGRAPQGLALSADGATLYVQNFMDRSVSVVDLTPLTRYGELRAVPGARLASVASERLAPQVLAGKQLFYDARDPRLARDSYMSCASCHNDGGHDGRVWDLTGFGEGLRNTIALRGRAALGHGFLHWSANFDELQDFEGQIRALAGGTGLMPDAVFNAGTRNTPLGDLKAGQSADLDALAAYVASLDRFDASPARQADGALTPAAAAGRSVYQSAGCLACHAGAGFTVSGNAGALKSVGTIKPASGRRLGGALNGLDVPTLRDAWATAPYLHDGSAPTLAAAVQAHQGNTVSGADLANLVAYLQQIGSEEAGFNLAPSTGTGLQGSYFASNNLTGAVVLQRVEAINFDWGGASPAAALPADNFSARWTGYVEATSAGAYQFQTNSDDGVRVWVNGQRVINNWTVHGATLDTSPSITLAAGQRVPVTVEYQEFGGGAVMQLRWKPPGAAAFLAIPVQQLYTQPAGGVAAPPPNAAPTVTLTAPAAGTAFGQGTVINLTANAADGDGSITRVEFYDGATLIGSDTTAPYALAWSGAAVGSHTLTARAFDNAGATTTSAAVTVSVNAATAPAGTGLQGSYFASNNLSGAVALRRVEAVNFNWGVGSPGTGVPADNFSARWTGELQATTAGSYQFQTNSDDGVRVWVNGQPLINNWTVHAPTLDTSVPITLAAGQRVAITVEYQEFGGGAVMQLSWKPPGAAAFTVIPAGNLYPVTLLATPPADAVACANEGQTCTLPAGRIATVWYGANTAWVLRTNVTGSIGCNNATFGDPLYGTVKSCRYR